MSSSEIDSLSKPARDFQTYSFALRDVLGARVWRLHRAYRFACSPFMAGFMELKHSERRQLKTAGSVVAGKGSPRTPSSAAAA